MQIYRLVSVQAMSICTHIRFYFMSIYTYFIIFFYIFAKIFVYKYFDKA